MHIQLNDTTIEITNTTSLSDVLTSQRIDTTAIAVARNGHIIHREQWAHTQLRNADTITVVQAVAGG